MLPYRYEKTYEQRLNMYGGAKHCLLIQVYARIYTQLDRNIGKPTIGRDYFSTTKLPRAYSDHRFSNIARW